jgi:hypothetical protein
MDRAGVRVTARALVDVDDLLEEPPDDVELLGEFVPTTMPSLQRASSIERPSDVDVTIADGLLYPKSLFVLAAQEGIGKTRMVIEIAVRCSTGRGAIFGRYAVPRPIRVAMIDEENGEAHLWREEEAVIAAVGVTRPELVNLSRVSFAGMHLAKADRQAWLVEELRRERPDLVILDTGGAMVDDEHGPALKDGIRFLRRTIRELGCSFVVLVHLTKAPRDRSGAGDRLHGSALADVMGQWTRHADVVATALDLGADRVRFAVRKRIAPSTVILAKADDLWTYVADADAPVARDRIDDRILAAIAAGAERAEDVSEALAVSRRSVYNALRRLRDAGFVAPGAPLRLTDDGIEAVE